MSRDPKLRLFIAAYPPPGVAERLLAMLPTLDLPEHRASPPDQVHLTIHFVGPTPVRDLDRVCKSVERAAAGIASFDLCAERLITLPRRGRVRLLAANLDQPPGLMEIQRRLATRLARHARARPGDRYLPHMTLCRFTARARDIDLPIENQPAFHVSDIRLMKSVLNPQGAEHSLVKSVALL